MTSFCDIPIPRRPGEMPNRPGSCCLCKKNLGWYDTKFVEDYSGRIACFAHFTLDYQYALLKVAGMSNPPGWSVYSDG